MRPSIKRRTFLQTLIGIPACFSLWPRQAEARTRDGATWTDDQGTSNLMPVYDNDLLTGITYGA